jgi:tight adherence protein C
MPPVMLSAGLVALFVAIAGLVVAAGWDERGDPRVRRLLDAVGAMPAPDTREPRQAELAVPFAQRVLAPLLLNFVALGRRLTPDAHMRRICHRLGLAGHPAGWDADRVVGLRALAALTGLVLGLGAPASLGADAPRALATAVTMAAAGWASPVVWLRHRAGKRSERIRRDLPDALDIMTISVEAGLAFDAAMAQVARRTRGPLAEEFLRVLRQMQFGASRAEAMRAFGERTDVTELRTFLQTMAQADDLGVPIAGVLRVQSDDMRVKRSQRAEEAAQKIPTKIAFPLILCILPCLLIIVLGPAALSLVHAFGGTGL